MESTSRQESTVYLTPDELRARWADAVTRKTLSNWRAMGRGPSFVVIGGKARYRLSDVEEWEQRQLASTLPRPRNQAGPGGGDVRTR